MKNSFFSSENWLWTPFNWIADFLILSCLWLLCSVPVVTAGAAFTALYDCASHCMLRGEREMFSRFFRTFRRELKLGSFSVILWAAVFGGAVLLVRSFTGSAAGTDGNLAVAYGFVILLIVLVGIAAWVFPLLSRFTFTFGALQTTALKLAFVYLPRTMVLAAVNGAAGWVCVRFLVPVMVVPAIAALLSALLLEPVFKKYETGDAGENNG